MRIKTISDIHPLSKYIFLPFYRFIRRKLKYSQSAALIATNILSGFLHGLLVLIFKDYKQALAIGIIFTVISIALSFVLVNSKTRRKLRKKHPLINSKT